MKSLWLGLSLLLPPCAAFAEGLEPLKYNHPGLKVDLGVGLWAWPVPCDADGDGDFDLIVSCPDKPSNGVWLFENATGDTAQDKFPVFKPARRLSKTAHYVMPSYVDGKLRVLTPGFEHPGFEKTGLEQRVALPVAANFYKPEGKQPKGPKVRHNQWRYADYDGDGALDLIVGIEDWSFYGWDDAWNAKGEWTNGPLHGFVILHRNAGSTAAPQYAPPVKLEAGGRPIDVFGCPSPNFADFDGDGDLDLLCGEFLDGFTYFENIGSQREPQYAAGRRMTNDDGTPLALELQMIVPVAFDWDRDGDLDLIVGDEDGRVALVECRLHAPREDSRTGPRSVGSRTFALDGSIATDESILDRLSSRGAMKATLRFLAPRYFQQEADTLKCGALATPVGFDWDCDGDTDIVSGNTAGYIELFENLSGPRVAAPKWAAPQRLAAGGKTFRVQAGANGSIQGPAEAKWGYTTLSIADWDADGLPDIVFNSILGRVQWLKNVGSRTAPQLAEPQPIEVDWPNAASQPAPKPAWTWWTPTGRELVTQWRTTPVVYDFNADGLVDLAMLDTEGFLSFFERAQRNGQLGLLPPRRAFVDEKGTPLRLNSRTTGGSGRRKLCVTDWNGDGKLDFLLNSANADFLQQVGEKDGVWMFRNAGTLAKQNIEGHDVSPGVVDFDDNDIPDFLGGAEDGRFYHLRNPRPSREQ